MTEIEITYEELIKDFLLLRPLGEEKLPITAALKVRKIHNSLKPDVLIHAEIQNKILVENNALKDGEQWKMKDGEIQFKTKAGRAKALDQLKELAETKLKVSIVPLEERDLASATELTIEPSLLISLEEAGLLTLTND